MPVGWVAGSGQRYGGHAYKDALAAARERGVAVVVPACRQRWVDDDVALTFLSPCGPQFADGTNDVNENSLAVLVEYRTLRALSWVTLVFNPKSDYWPAALTCMRTSRYPQSRASRFSVFVECRIHRGRPSALCDRVRRPPQPVRPPGTNHAGYIASCGSFDLSDGSMWSSHDRRRGRRDASHQLDAVVCFGAGLARIPRMISPRRTVIRLQPLTVFLFDALRFIWRTDTQAGKTSSPGPGAASVAVAAGDVHLRHHPSGRCRPCIMRPSGPPMCVRLARGRPSRGGVPQRYTARARADRKDRGSSVQAQRSDGRDDR